ncbi:DUF6554 family protein [Synechococcus sp. M16CYN]|uniref:DUF6554 family protein n=1 Tax=Synechococcus sp. M16CYN TaxID=3103139 RepID=UPI0032455F74
MPRFGYQFILTTLTLVSTLFGGIQVVRASNATEEKGARIYCFMRSSGNSHIVSWNAAYAVIKRQGKTLFRTSPEHASVMITEAVVNDPRKFPDCGQFLGDLFSSPSNKASTTPVGTNATAINDERYSY